MRKLLEESPVYNGMSLIIDVIFAGMIWVVTSLPVITIGASSAALYYVVTKTIRRGRGNLLKSYFSAFRSNFKQSTLIWLIYILYATVGIADMYAIGLMGLAEGSVLDHISKLFFVPAAATLPWVFAFVSRFENTVGGTLKFVAYLTMRHIGRTLLLVGLFLLCAVIAWLLPQIGWLLPAICCLAMSYVIEPVFKAQTENREDGNADPWYNE